MPFEVHAFCPCGWHVEAPFGDTFHVHYTVCPACGKHKRHWTTKTIEVSHAGQVVGTFVAILVGLTALIVTAAVMFA